MGAAYLYDANVAEFALLEVVRVVIRHDVRVLQLSHDTETNRPTHTKCDVSYTALYHDVTHTTFRTSFTRFS